MLLSDLLLVSGFAPNLPAQRASYTLRLIVTGGFMKKWLIGIVFVAASPLYAQQAPAPAPAPPAPGEVVVARVNGETITKAKLDQLWNRLGQRARQQYDKTGGGKAGFLDNYVRKVLMLQQARKSGFEKKPDVQAELEAAKESALFDLYVREVVSAQVVSEADLRKFYLENEAQMQRPEQVRVRYLLVATKDRLASDAMERITEVMTQLFSERRAIVAAGGGVAEVAEAFSNAARRYSDDVTGPSGGNLGWTSRAELDAKLADTAFMMTPGAVSGILETPPGLVLLYVEGHRPAAQETFEEVRPALREFLLNQKSAQIVEHVDEVTANLLKDGKVEVFRQNVD